MPTTPLPSLLINIPHGVIDLGWGHPSARLHPAAALAAAADRTAWRWPPCDDAAMTTNCKLAQSGSAAQTCTECTPVVGADTDVGKYLQAYAYYAAPDDSAVA